jgi:nitrogen fixation protein FixH
VRRGWYWPLLLGGLLLAGVSANLYLLVRASGDPSFAVESDYYAKAVAWDAHQEQAAKNAALGWSAAIEVAPASLATGRARVVVRLVDREGRGVAGARVTLEAFHNARAGAVVHAAFEEDAEHAYVADAPIVRPGLWEFRIAAERGADRFTSVIDQDAPGVER